MDNARTLRRKAARFFENAASSATAKEAEKLNDVGRQLEIWADDLEEIADDLEEINDAQHPSRGNESQRRTGSYRVRGPDADTHSLRCGSTRNKPLLSPHGR
jgi:hypothetical protein